MKVEGVDRSVGHEPGKGEAGVVGEHFAPRPRALTLEPLVHERDPFALYFEADHGNVGASGEPLQHEPAAPWTYLDFDVSPRSVDQASKLDVALRRQHRSAGIALAMFVDEGLRRCGALGLVGLHGAG